jgi:hypothetical protein
MDLLPDFGQQGQAPPLLLETDHLQSLVTDFELKEFQFQLLALRPSMKRKRERRRRPSAEGRASLTFLSFVRMLKLPETVSLGTICPGRYQQFSIAAGDARLLGGFTLTPALRFVAAPLPLQNSLQSVAATMEQKRCRATAGCA